MATHIGVTSRKPGKGRVYSVLGDKITCKLSGDESGDAFSIFEVSVPPLGGPPPHIHLHEEEAYYVLVGEFEFQHGDRTVSASAGAFVHFSRGALHTYRNVGTEPGRLLAIFSPAGVEHYFEAMDELARQEPTDSDSSAAARVASRFAILCQAAS
jgi:quercetin dioxygenase-like cupin family protein